MVKRFGVGLVVLGALLAVVLLLPGSAAAACANPVACENALPGDPPSDWQVTGVGDSSIQGYATSMSVNVGQTINFKINTPATSYHIDILRLGYYGGDGARKIAAGIRPSASLPQSQPACLTDSSTGLIDCGNWGVSASWTVPADAVSGVYIAHLVRDDTGGDSQIPFVVRNDASHSDILLSTSDATWQAYNAYGGNSLYSCTVACPPGNPLAYKAAYAVSYNRPFDGTLTTDNGQSDLYYAEYQMIRFLEKQGYDISYTSSSDVDARGSLLLNHKIFVSSAHDEYWSAGQRANVTEARDAKTPVNLAFFSGNEVFWKTRWDASHDGSNTPDRTLITYKETHFDAPTDPLDTSPTWTWTGTWRDPRFSPPADGEKPENSLTGQYFLVNSGTNDIRVPSQYAKARLWRNTPVANLAAGQTVTLGAGIGTLGYEWDEDVDDASRPAGLVDLSSTTGLAETFTDYGSSTALNQPATHHLTLYRAPSGALVFGGGTVQWSWGLDNTNAWGEGSTDPSGLPPDPTMQQATVNLLADMHAQPATLQAGLVAASASSDSTPPSSTITSPTGGSFPDGKQVTVTGNATDAGGGVVAGVEVSTDSGSTWHPATLTTADGTSVNWSYTWVAHGVPSTKIETRATDDSGNLETPSAGVSVSISCPCSLWGSTPTTPADSGDPGAVELGMQFKADTAGVVSGIRFYKVSANTGTHVGSLWTASGQLLAQATFTGETSSGWQQVNFSNPVAIAANTTYVVSYYAPAGHYAYSSGYFYLHPSPEPDGDGSADSPPLHAVRDTAGSINGLYAYSSTPTFPTNTYQAENYWVDPVFSPSCSSGPPGQVTGVTAVAGNGQATISWSAPSDCGSPITSYTITPYVGGVAQTAKTITGSPPATNTTITGLTNGTTYTFTVAATNAKGTGAASTQSNTVTPTAPTVPTAPTNVTATAGNTQATVTWTAPADGGSAITSYTITPYIGSTAQTPTTITGSPPATNATITGLTNGTTYTFKVAATNAIGTGPASAASNTVTPTPTSNVPTFVQQRSVHSTGVASASVTPTKAITAGNRMVVEVGIWSSANATAKSVTDAAGNQYTEILHFVASDGTEMSIWTAPITAGGGTMPKITVTPTGPADIGVAAVEYSGLSTAAGLGSVDQSAQDTGTTSLADTVSSGATPPTTASNELAVGIYADSGFGDTLSAGSGFTSRVNVSNTSDMELLVEDQLPALRATPNATARTGASTPWLMATVVFKHS